ncbi:MAG: 23S rRNA (adenine(2503)-C(2))-methyltransferase RlmN [candidate division KSB1 bacterium]|nr:23S rRNA (adenine(2503)-C(2))-methyltransferase RlmN [candidate division KSB1 bacterium]MDZ7275312.1 23S rRNA (adenine(2503)-C(2))-methyltransferase RlmN [candidate division KSB1 bacterium]MDZ7287480.1 23S rRNA (adenine(2503)-C(2))-methyltransferase RlmN [candidate division KSB1 bacterium]MDZ7299594.1 23S rRNA (adenine(2503)-C(2))-methyltransferase RlmN [candidate division KSB1 bacterium]MDZ7307468.1 23S rRNA (adenine(2503)-C(2))-methyltransferase RlmN [candidate division KSB1 bacterium]
MINTRQKLLGMSREELVAFCLALGEKPFRGRQLFQWIYGRSATSFAEMTNLSLALRARLAETAELAPLEVVQRRLSRKGDAEKLLFRLADGLEVESVMMSEGDRHTLCLSSQVGCPIDCAFCATGKMGLLRNLSAGEIINQLLTAQRVCGRKVTNVVLMGMGEPFNNYEAVIKACQLMADPEGPNLGQRHIVISTSGLIPRIRQFTAEGHKFRLAISLNATTDEVRNRLMPLNRKYPIAELLAAARDYAQQAKQRVTFEYVLLAGVNDSLQDADRLKKLVAGIPCKINLIPYNAVDESFQRPPAGRIEAFYRRLQDLTAPVTLRWSKGDDIDAACGQLWTKAARSAPGRVAVGSG